MIAKESEGNARLVRKANYGLMQIRLGIARELGCTGSGSGLLDPDTNLKFAVKYLAGALRAAMTIARYKIFSTATKIDRNRPS